MVYRGKIVVYNSYGECEKIYKDVIEASEGLDVSVGEIKLNLEGKNLHIHRKILRYESDPFDKYPRSKYLQPVTLYTLQGEFVCNFECKKDAEIFLGVSHGEIAKVLKRGGSCNNYLISEYGKPLERKLYRDHFEIEMLDKSENVIKTFANKSEIYKYYNISDCHNLLNKAINDHTLYRDHFWRIKQEFKIA